MKEIHTLIEKTKLIIKYNPNLVENANKHFNIFQVCGVNHYENIHSSIIAEFLKTDGTHGFKERFLEAFLKVLVHEKIIGNPFYFSCANAKIETEHYTTNGRLDILITDTEERAIIIENKVYAGDQPQQLKRYSEYAKQKFKSNILLYLTLFGDSASEGSNQGVEYKQISYSETIIKWLEMCVGIAARNAVVRETLIQYINYLKKLTDQDMETQNNKELIEFLSDKENLQATLLIGQNTNVVKNHIVNKVFLPQLTKICKDLGLTNESAEEEDWFNTSWAGFQIKNPKWKYFQIALEFEKRGFGNCIIGFHYFSDKKNDKTFKKLKEKIITKDKTNENWAYRSFSANNWDYEQFLDIINGKMAEIFKKEIKELLEMAKGLDM